jgi:hypothetical protein
MGRQAAIDVQAQMRRHMSGARKAAPSEAPLPKPQTGHAILAVGSNAFGVSYLCKDARRGYWAATSHLERAHRFATVEDAAAACDAWWGPYPFQPVVAAIKVTFRRPEET